MDSESTPSSSSCGHIWKYDVFLSFSPEDTSNHFTSYLYFSLLRNEVKTLVHEDKKQEYNSSNILKQIEKSRISIVVFSKNYVASTSRLEELSKIAECIDSVKEKQIVFVVFYDLKPCEVRQLEKGVYEKVFGEYEQIFKQNLQKVERWKKAITKVANMEYAWIVRKQISNGVKTQVICDIVRSAKNKLSSKSSSDTEFQVEALQNLLDINNSDDVFRVIGICGMRGSGKTSLASLLYHRISHKFDAFCFLPRVTTLYSLQKQLLHQTLHETNLKISDNVHKGSSLIATRLRNLKILLVLDDVRHIQILKELVGNHNHDWFGVGSRIIITTTDHENILKSYGVNQIYKVKLSKNEKESVHQHLESRLSSYMEKDTFLDIACFFVGENIHNVIDILSDCKLYPESVIEDLIRNSVIRISHDDQKIEMHYMLQELGQNFVQQESPKKPGRRSRLWLDEDFRHVMKTNTGTEKIKAIVLNPKVPEETPLRVDGLSKMDGLQLLIIRNVKFSGVLKGLSKRLRYVSWHRYPFTCLPSSFEANNLVQLIMPHSNIIQLWKDSKILGGLRSLDLHGSKNLIEMPNFKSFPDLGKLNLEGCIGLVMLHPSIAFLRELNFLNLRNCTSLVSVLNNLFALSSLEILNVAGCSKFAECLDFDDWRSSIKRDEEVLSNQDLPLSQEVGCGINREQAKSIEASSSTITEDDEYPNIA